MAYRRIHTGRQAAPAVLALFGLLAWLNPASAALLKDVRIGDHEAFTRIVLELDSVVAGSPEVTAQEGWLAVVLEDTRPDLNRKIPAPQSRRIESFQLRVDKNHLSASFQLAAPPAKVETKKIGNPPRLIVDLYWPSGSAAAAKLPQALELPQAADQPALPAQALAQAEPAGGQKPAEMDVLAPSTVAPPADDKLPDATPPQASTPTLRLRLPEKAADSTPAGRSDSKPFRIQRYLVTLLIILAAAVLFVLVVLLLLSRHAAHGDSQTLSASEHLKRQEDRLASVNARIREQLQRYEKV